MKLLLTLLFACLPALAAAQTYSVRWPHDAVSQSYTVCVTGQTCVSIPASTALVNGQHEVAFGPLADGTYTASVQAVNGTATATGSTNFTVGSAPPPGGLSPVQNFTVKAGTSVTMSVDTAATTCTAKWVIGTQDNSKGCTVTPTGFKFTEVPSSTNPPTRTWWFILCSPGIPCADTEHRTINVVP